MNKDLRDELNRLHQSIAQANQRILNVTKGLHELKLEVDKFSKYKQEDKV